MVTDVFCIGVLQEYAQAQKALKNQEADSLNTKYEALDQELDESIKVRVGPFSFVLVHCWVCCEEPLPKVVLRAALPE